MPHLHIHVPSTWYQYQRLIRALPPVIHFLANDELWSIAVSTRRTLPRRVTIITSQRCSSVSVCQQFMTSSYDFINDKVTAHLNPFRIGRLASLVVSDSVTAVVDTTVLRV
jgi:hypothetical protein